MHIEHVIIVGIDGLLACAGFAMNIAVRRDQILETLPPETETSIFTNTLPCMQRNFFGRTGSASY